MIGVRQMRKPGPSEQTHTRSLGTAQAGTALVSSSVFRRKYALQKKAVKASRNLTPTETMSDALGRVANSGCVPTAAFLHFRGLSGLFHVAACHQWQR